MHCASTPSVQLTPSGNTSFMDAVKPLPLLSGSNWSSASLPMWGAAGAMRYPPPPVTTVPGGQVVVQVLFRLVVADEEPTCTSPGGTAEAGPASTAPTPAARNTTNATRAIRWAVAICCLLHKHRWPGPAVRDLVPTLPGAACRPLSDGLAAPGRPA